ncbi:MAG: glycosyltransferase family 4 protein [Desulfomonile tiedjei]|uniref:Glycosyltransferase family 4 protein n=1 Tax=Desulfomonile tiedjei TaxID=2358 RepID=A0A9D6V2Q7_9BACT|nr:glycosyltransferase family 4 protein [Desulfomonile tiedjei]
MKRRSGTRVLFVSHSSELRGAEKSLGLLLRGIRTEEIDPVVILPGRGGLYDQLSALGFPVYDVPMWWWLPPLGDTYPTMLTAYRAMRESVPAVRNIIRTHGIQAVHSNSLVVMEGALAASLETLPHVWHVREILDEASGLSTPLGLATTLGIVEELSDKVVAVSKTTARQFGNSTKVEVVYNGVTISKDRSAQLPGRDGSLKVAFVGSLIERKGADLFVEACLAFSNLDMDFYLVGDEGDRALTQGLKDRISRAGKASRFHFLGFRADISSILEAMDIYVLSSRNDPFPRTVIEAMAAGCAVVVTKSGGAIEAVEACGSGEVVEPSADSIAEGIKRFIDQPAYRRACGESGRKKVNELFSSTIYVSRMTELLNNVAANGRAPRMIDHLIEEFLSGNEPSVQPLPRGLLRRFNWLFGRS